MTVKLYSTLPFMFHYKHLYSISNHLSQHVIITSFTEPSAKPLQTVLSCGIPYASVVQTCSPIVPLLSCIVMYPPPVYHG